MLASNLVSKIRKEIWFLEILSGSSLWSKGSPDDWYDNSRSGGFVWSKWWKQSMMAHIGLELFIYIIIYYIIHLIYMFALNEKQKYSFDKVMDKFIQDLTNTNELIRVGWLV